MRNKLLQLLVALAISGCLPVCAQSWTTGKLILSGQSYDHYRVYKVAIALDRDRAAILWNFSGSFKDACQGTGRCEAASRVIEFMLSQCKASPADICMSEIPISYSLSTCAGTYPCLGLAFPKNPLKDQTRKTVKVYFAGANGSLIRPKEEIDADLRSVCVTILASASCPDLNSSIPPL